MYLNCHTAYSFKYGTLQVKHLFEEAKRCGVRKLVLSEINNTASYIEMLRQCKENAPVQGGLNKYGKEASCETCAGNYKVFRLCLLSAGKSEDLTILSAGLAQLCCPKTCANLN